MTRDFFAFVRGATSTGAPYKASGRWALYASHLAGYMRRWILRTPWGTLRVHNILRDDTGTDPHDHPFDFTSLIVKGGYTETRCLGPDVRGRLRFSWPCRYAAGAVVRRLAKDLHILTDVSPGTWTLVVTGPLVREWGFLTPTGWVDWKTYTGNGQAVRLASAPLLPPLPASSVAPGRDGVGFVS